MFDSVLRDEWIECRWPEQLENNNSYAPRRY